MHLNINARDARLRTYDQISKVKCDWKREELSMKSMGKFLHKIFKIVVKKLNNSLPSLG